MRLYYISTRTPFHNPFAFREYDEHSHTVVFSDVTKALWYMDTLDIDVEFKMVGGHWVSDVFLQNGKKTFYTVSINAHTPKQYIEEYYTNGE